jgi:antitoxin component YwqK of YwqJK toxin-antitoxin module
MKKNLLLTSLLATMAIGISSSLLAQSTDSLGFTNKAEAKNLLVNGLKEGKWVEYINEDDEASSEDSTKQFYCLFIYKAGKPVGLVRSYFKNGKLKGVTPFANGVMNGVVKEYYESGKLKGEHPYTNDLENGADKEYYENGKLKTVITFKDGQEISTKKYDINGKEIK